MKNLSQHQIEGILEEGDLDTPRGHRAIQLRDHAILTAECIKEPPTEPEDSGVYIPPPEECSAAEEAYGVKTAQAVRSYTIEELFRC